MSETNYPETKFRSRKMNVSIWPNEVETKDGVRVTKNAQLQKSYKDASGEWKNHNIPLFADDIPDAILVLNEALRYIRLKEQNEE